MIHRDTISGVLLAVQFIFCYYIDMLRSKNFFFVFLVIAVVIIAGIFLFKDFKSPNEAAQETNLEDDIGLNIEENSNAPLPKADDEGQKQQENKDLPAKQEARRLEELRAKMPDLDKSVAVAANIDAGLKKRFMDEISVLVNSIKDNFNHLNLWLQLGILKKTLGDYEGAAEAWQFANLAWPQNAISFNNLGNLYGFYLKDFPESEANYLKSIENDPKNLDAYKSLADIYQYSYTEKQDLVDDILLRGLSSNPNNIDFMFMLARYYVDIGNLDGAVVYYNTILKIDSNNKQALEELAVINQ